MPGVSVRQFTLPHKTPPDPQNESIEYQVPFLGEDRKGAVENYRDRGPEPKMMPGAEALAKGGYAGLFSALDLFWS